MATGNTRSYCIWGDNRNAFTQARRTLNPAAQRTHDPPVLSSSCKRRPWRQRAEYMSRLCRGTVRHIRPQVKGPKAWIARPFTKRLITLTALEVILPLALRQSRGYRPPGSGAPRRSPASMDLGHVAGCSYAVTRRESGKRVAVVARRQWPTRGWSCGLIPDDREARKLGHQLMVAWLSSCGCESCTGLVSGTSAGIRWWRSSGECLQRS